MIYQTSTKWKYTLTLNSITLLNSLLQLTGVLNDLNKHSANCRLCIARVYQVRLIEHFFLSKQAEYVLYSF